MNAPESEIYQAIKKCGLANVKAKRIRTILSEIYQEEGRLDLNFPCRLTPKKAKEYLTSFKGVGPKSAAVVLKLRVQNATIPSRYSHLSSVTNNWSN